MMFAVSYFRRDERFGYYLPDQETDSDPERSEEEWAEGDHAMELLKRGRPTGTRGTTEETRFKIQTPYGGSSE